MTYTQHPLSAAFPSMPAEDFQSLKDSIETNGVLNPITLFEGQVIDGWHRYTAANEVGQNCPTQELESWIDPKDYVLAQNKNRRHITVAQLATATAAVYGWYSVGDNQHKGGSVVPTEAPKSSKELAAIAGVSTASIEKAKTVQTKAAPEVQQAVKDGKIGLEKAVAISKLPKEDQAAAIAKPLPRNITPIRPEYSEADQMADKLKEAHHAIDEMQEEMTALKDGIATEGDPDSKELITSLRAEIKLLTIELNAIKSQRDILQGENRELMSQCKYYERKLKAA
jgi:hypothetical protein